MNMNVTRPMQPCSNNTQFKGLWGKPQYDRTETLYGGEFECDYYKKPYHPCKDETLDQIKFTLNQKQQSLDIVNKSHAMNPKGDYVGVTIGSTLKLTQQELAELTSDSKNIVRGNLPKHNLDLVM